MFIDVMRKIFGYDVGSNLLTTIYSHAVLTES